MRRWGSWWAIQSTPGLSFGVHIDIRCRLAINDVRYGPYIDLHVFRWIVSLGVNPIYSGEIDLLQSWAHGGINANRAE
jgi:hypothetical protein